MKYGMFSIYDEKAQAFLPPFILPETGMAIRTFGDCINSQEHQFGKHPADYTLYQIAEFDDDTGIPTPDKKTIHNGLELKKSDIEKVPNYES
jgi:hypothetical protein